MNDVRSGGKVQYQQESLPSEIQRGIREQPPADGMGLHF
jgi:hypothetical protein